MKVEDIRHEMLLEILHRENITYDDAAELADELSRSTLIAGHIEGEGLCTDMGQ